MVGVIWVPFINIVPSFVNLYSNDQLQPNQLLFLGGPRLLVTAMVTYLNCANKSSPRLSTALLIAAELLLFAAQSIVTDPATLSGWFISIWNLIRTILYLLSSAWLLHRIKQASSLASQNRANDSFALADKKNESMVEINVPILHIKSNEKPLPLNKREGRRLMSRVEDPESVQTGSKEGGRSRGQSNLSIDINNKDNQ